MENNKNTVPVVPVEGKKKKHTFRNIVISVAAVFVVIGLWPSSDKDSVPSASETKEAQETQFEESKTEDIAADEEAEQEEKMVSIKDDGRNYLEIGGTYDIGDEDGNRWEYTVADINIARAISPIDSTDNYIFYIDLEVHNTTDGDLVVRDTGISMYVDDFQVDNNQWAGYIDSIFPDIECESVAINSGRKAKFRYYTTMPVDNAKAVSSIELEINGLVALFKDDGEWLYGLGQIEADEKEAEHTAMVTDQILNGIGTDPISLVYGRYHVAINTISGRNEAYVQFNPDYGDVITIYCTDSEGREVGDFAGYLRNDGNYYTVVDGSCDMEYAHVTFVKNGMRVEAINREDYESRYGVPLINYCGNYYLDEEYDTNAVG